MNTDDDTNNNNSRSSTNVKYQPLSIEETTSKSTSRPSSSTSLSIYHIPTEQKHHNHHQQLWTVRLLALYSSFWSLGLLNNASYVIMIAAAKNISEGGTAIVFLANIVPALVIKASAPYWFDYTSYATRLRLATICMCSCFIFVASSTTTTLQLLGVAFASLQGGLGEASLLALAGKVDGGVGNSCTTITDENDDGDTKNDNHHKNENDDKGRCLTSFSSGTGAAGVFGFLWKWFLNDFVGLSLSTTLWIALLSLPICYWGTFTFVDTYWQNQIVQKQQQQQQQQMATGSEDDTFNNRYRDNDHDLQDDCETETESTMILGGITSQQHVSSSSVLNNEVVVDTNSVDKDVTTTSSSLDQKPETTTTTLSSNGSTSDGIILVEDSGRRQLRQQHEQLQLRPVNEMTTCQRCQFVIFNLWPYMIPLFVVYVAEYALQSGTWTAIGFPTIHDKEARTQFFVYANWCYQLGVFLSRSSGTIFTAPMLLLWLMPILQVINVFVYWNIAATANDDEVDEHNSSDDDTSFLHQPSVLYFGAFYAGLLGGCVYIHAYKRICKDLPLQYREFSLAAASVAECLGIVVADFLGLIIQSCLYKIHGMESEAIVSCPI